MRLNPRPSFHVVSATSPSGPPPSTINTIYRKTPLSITSSNTETRRGSDPPFSLDTTMPAFVYHDIQQETVSARLPEVFSPDWKKETWRALRAESNIADSSQVGLVKNQSYAVNNETAEDLLNTFRHFHETIMKFVSELGRLHILEPQTLRKHGDERSKIVPHPVITHMYETMHQSVLDTLLDADFPSVADTVDALNRYYSRVADAIAIADFALLYALDVCAMLGGVELPHWPPCDRWQGAQYDLRGVPLEGVGLSENHAHILAEIRMLERWGAPIWTFQENQDCSRYDYDRGGLPNANEYEEGLLQARLKNIWDNAGPGVTKITCVDIVKRVHTKGTHQVVEPSYRTAQTSLLDRGAVTHGVRCSVQTSILRLLDHSSSSQIKFNEFSNIVEDKIGREIWERTRHENGLHPNPNMMHVDERIQWSQVRDAGRESNHYGVQLARFETPRTWIYPSSFVAMPTGEYPHLKHYVAPSSTVPRGTWYIVDLDDLIKDSKIPARLAGRFASSGLYGFRVAVSKVQNKDANNKTIPNSRYTAQFVFKTPNDRENFALTISRQHMDCEQRLSEEEEGQEGFTNKFLFELHPQFIDIVYSHPISDATRTQLIESAPLFALPVESEDCALRMKHVLFTMRHYELLQTNMYRPITRPDDGTHGDRLGVGLDMVTCRPITLCNIALSEAASVSLSFAHVCALQRFAYIMFILASMKGEVQFLSRIHVDNGPYRSIIIWLSRHIQQQKPEGSSFRSRVRRVQSSPFYEAVRLNSSKMVELIINIDPIDRRPNILSKEELQMYQASLDNMWSDFSKKPSRSEAKRARNNRKIQEGIQIVNMLNGACTKQPKNFSCQNRTCHTQMTRTRMI